MSDNKNNCKGGPSCNGVCNCVKQTKFSRKQYDKLFVSPAVGFVDGNDFFTTLLGTASFKLVGLMALIGGGISAISGYVYADKSAVYSLAALLLCDAITGVANALYHKTFTSQRLPRVLGVAVSYFLLLAMSTQAARFNEALTFLPGALYLGFTGVLIVSLIENLGELGLLPKSLVKKILGLIKTTTKK